MSTTLAALAVVAIGYLLTALVFNRLRDRFGYAGGAEYVVLGVLLGPRVAGFLGADVVRDLTPLVSLAIGWMGIHLGLFFRFPTLAVLDRTHVGMAFTEAVATLVGSGAASLALFHWALGLPWAEAAMPAVTLAAIATVTAPVVIDALAPRFGTRPLFAPLQLTARIDALVGVLAFGLLLAAFHQGDVAPTVRQPTATEWAVINVAVGVACGVLFHLFLGRAEDAEDGNARLFVSMAGATVVASGASYYLNLSPIFTNLVLGVMLANSGSTHREVRRFLESSARPVYLALLIFAGAAWRPGALELLFLAPAFIAIRVLARLGGGWLAGTWAAPPALREPRYGRALLAQGGLSAAIAINFGQVLPGPLADAVLTAALLAILLFELLAKPEAETVLAGEPAAPPGAAPGAAQEQA